MAVRKTGPTKIVMEMNGYDWTWDYRTLSSKYFKVRPHSLDSWFGCHCSYTEDCPEADFIFAHQMAQVMKYVSKYNKKWVSRQLNWCPIFADKWDDSWIYSIPRIDNRGYLWVDLVMNAYKFSWRTEPVLVFQSLHDARSPIGLLNAPRLCSVCEDATVVMGEGEDISLIEDLDNGVDGLFDDAHFYEELRNTFETLTGSNCQWVERVIHWDAGRRVNAARNVRYKECMRELSAEELRAIEQRDAREKQEWAESRVRLLELQRRYQEVTGVALVNNF